MPAEHRYERCVTCSRILEPTEVLVYAEHCRFCWDQLGAAGGKRRLFRIVGGSAA